MTITAAELGRRGSVWVACDYAGYGNRMRLHGVTLSDGSVLVTGPNARLTLRPEQRVVIL